MAWPLTGRIGRLWLNVPCTAVSVGPVSFTLTPVHAAFWNEHGGPSTVSAHSADGLTELLIEWVSYDAAARTAEIRIGGVSIRGIAPPAGNFTGVVMLAWGGVTPRATGTIPPGAATVATIASAAGVTILDGGRAGQQRDTVIMRVGERLKFAYAIPLASYAYPFNGRLDATEVSWTQFKSRAAPGSAVISEDSLLVMEHPRYPGVRFVVATLTALASGSDRLDVLVGTLTAGCPADPHDGELQHYSATVTVL